MKNEEEFKKAFKDAWNEHIEPHIESGKLVWECSPTLAKGLIEGWKYTEEEIMDLREAGK